MTGSNLQSAQTDKIRVLVVDDSSLIRRMVSRIFESDSEILLTGTARNGIDALGKLDAMKPDVVTLDVEMPEMDGLETLREIARRYPTIRVIMLSSLTARGTSVTLDALMSGASDLIALSSFIPMTANGCALRLIVLYLVALPTNWSSECARALEAIAGF